MSVTFVEQNRCFYLSGGQVSYVLCVDEQGELENLYWGKRVPEGSVKPALDRYYAVASFDKDEYRRPHEVPTRGSGWYGTPAVRVENAQGNDMSTLR